MINIERDYSTLKSKISIIWTLTKKNISLYIKSGPVLIFGLMFPIFLILSWIIGRNINSIQIFIGILAMTSFFTATAISPVILPIETRENSLERLTSSPVSLLEIIFGIMFASFIYSFFITSSIMIIFILLLNIQIFSISAFLFILVAIILMGFIGSLLGILVSANPTEKTSDVMLMMNLLKFPLLFISGIFIPFESLPLIVLIFSLFSPITFMVDILRFATNENNLFPLIVDISVSLLWIITLLIANYLIHKKTMLRRFSIGQKRKLTKGS